MSESILVAVHPGYLLNTGQMSEDYGDYDGYLTRLGLAVNSNDSIIFQHRLNKPPFEISDEIEVIYDRDRNFGRGKNAGKLISTLKEKGVKHVDLSGEELWAYGVEYSDEDIERDIKFFEDISSGKMDQSILSPTISGDEHIAHMRKLLLINCCVPAVYESLSEHFEVNLERELCYPTIEARDLLEQRIEEESVQLTHNFDMKFT